MEKHNYNYRRLMKRAFSYMYRALDQEKKLGEISNGLRKIVNSYAGLNRNERYWIYWECYKVCRAAKRSKRGWEKELTLNKNYKSVLRAARKVKASSELRKKKARVYSEMKLTDTIFWLCSTHSNCADDHKAYQGMIYVDRYWRQKVSGDKYYAVLSYIKNRKIKTVQEIMKGPVWLTTRPYCKHYFIALETDTVLHSSLKHIRENYGKTYEKEYDYYELRESIKNKIG